MEVHGMGEGRPELVQGFVVSRTLILAMIVGQPAIRYFLKTDTGSKTGRSL